MRTAVCFTMIALTGAASLAQAGTGNGLTPTAGDDGPRWQARVSTDATGRAPASWNDGGLKPRSLSVHGDYYFSRATWIPATLGGFRATGTMFLGTAGATLSKRSGLYALAPAGASTGLLATPYAGVGYSATSPKQGFSISADLGVFMPRSARTNAASQMVEESVRDFRLSPLLQLGVSYSF